MRVAGVRTPRIALLAALCVLLAAGSTTGARAQEEERILDYSSRIIIDQSGSMMVVETIVIEAHNDQIRHGIYRDFPTSYWGPLLTRVRVPFEVIEVTRDGAAEPYHTEDQKNGVRVYVGSEDRLVSEGVHTYAITYFTDRQLGFFDDHDELYWNITGNGWDFPIEKVQAEVLLPDGVPVDRITHEGYTGVKGSKEQALRSSVDAASGVVRFESTRTLWAGEGMTVVVGFPKGVIAEPTREDRWRAFLFSNQILFAGGIGVVVIALFYLLSWTLVGRDPPRGTIIPLFEPPLEMPPACVRYVYEMGYDERCLTAALVDMAVKQAIRIEDKDGVYTLERLDQAKTPLSGGERKLLQHLLSAKTLELVRGRTTAERMKKAIKALRRVLRLQYEGKMFLLNRPFVVAGLVLSALAVVATIIVGPPAAIAGFAFITVWLSFWTMGVWALLTSVVHNWRRFLGRSRGLFDRIGAGAGALFSTLFAIPFVGGEIVGLGLLAAMTSVWMIPILLALVGLNFLFYHLLKQPTHSGRKVMDDIEGFRMYLETAEGDDLRGLRPPDLTAEIFERFLPYAIALGVENDWTQRFEETLRAAGRSTDSYQPVWYHGSSSWSELGASGFASSVGSSMASAVSSAAVAPGSSSGGGGGGSSGGGGGGGGGGGW